MMRVNPYTLLKKEAISWIQQALSPHRKLMWHYDKQAVEGRETWRLDDLAERVRAADQLGYNVEIAWKDTGLYVEYVKKLPPPPVWY